jgi:peptidoglycan hydrolase-like protein with peptidoglycan-binding domain
VEAGTLRIGLNETGPAVVRLQQALVDLGHPKVTVSGTYDSATMMAVVEYQDEQAAVADGVGFLGQRTLRRLDRDFATRAPERTRATSYDSSAPDAGTRPLSDADGDEITRLLQPPPVAHAPGGPPEPFRNLAGSPQRTYKVRLKRTVDAQVSSQFAKADTKREAREEGRITPWAHIENLALIAKQRTDAVFGRYQTSPTFRHGVNLLDKWEREEQKITAANPARRRRIAESRVQKILDSAPGVRQVNRLHRAVVGRPEETAVMGQVKREVAEDRGEDLLTIQKGWPASSQPGTGAVSIQRVRSEDAAKNRATSWEVMQTLIHEYIHTLTHSHYRQYQETLGNAERKHTLKEGVTELLTRIVVSGLDHDSLRAQVEGDDYDAGDPIAIPGRAGKYQDAADRAEQIAGVVGISNVYAAYFLGRTDLIGRV